MGNALLKNLLTALSAASNTEGGEPDSKKAKVAQVPPAKGDAFNILDLTFSKLPDNTVAEGEGAILSRLTLSGLVNGLAVVCGI